MPLRNLGNPFAGGAALAADAARFAAAGSAGGPIATLTDPFGGGSTFQAIGTVPGQLALSGAQVVRGSIAASGGASYAIKIRATSADGRREVAETLSFAATGAAAPALAKLSGGLARVAAGSGRAIIAAAGDSVTAGWGAALASGSGTSAQPTALPIRARSWPQRLAARYAAAGVAVRADAVFGTNLLSTNTLADYSTMNPDLTIGSDWSYAAIQSLGGYGLRCQSGTQPTVFTPQVAANAFDIYYTLGTFQVADAGGTLATVVQAGGAFRRLTVTRAAATRNPISITRTGGTDMYVVGIVPYDTGSPRLEIWNMGWPGSTSAGWTAAGQPWFAYNAIPSLAPDLWMLELGANDIAGGMAAATYQANLQAIAAQMKAGGADVQLVKCHPAIYGDARNVPAAYLAAVDAVAGALSLPPAIDFNAMGLVATDYDDGIHLAAQGYDKQAQRAYDVLAARV